MNRKNPSKAQLRRANERLQRAAKREHADADRARDAMLASDRMRDNALQLLGEIAPDLLNLLVRPTFLAADPGEPMLPGARPLDFRDFMRAGCDPFAVISEEWMLKHWITRMRMEIECRPELLNRHVICFRMQRPRGKDSLAWQYAFDDELIIRGRTAVRWMIMGMAERLCDELEQKIGGGRG